jgi:hypothetical protein
VAAAVMLRESGGGDGDEQAGEPDCEDVICELHKGPALEEASFLPTRAGQFGRNSERPAASSPLTRCISMTIDLNKSQRLARI